MNFVVNNMQAGQNAGTTVKEANLYERELMECCSTVIDGDIEWKK